MDEKALLNRITVSPAIFGGKPIIRGRLAVEHVLELLAAGDSLGGANFVNAAGVLSFCNSPTSKLC